MRIFAAVFLLAILTPFAAAQKNPQSLDVLRRAEQAVGLDRLDLRTLTASGTLTRLDISSQAAVRPVRVKVIDLGRVRWEFETAAGPSFTVVDGNGGFNQLKGERTTLSLGSVSGLGLERLPLLALIRIIRSENVRVFAPETKEVAGAFCHVIRLHRLPPPGAPPELSEGFQRMTSAEWVIDADTLLPVLLRYREQPRDWRSDIEAQLEFTNYKQVGGLLFPATVIRSRAGVPADRIDFEEIRPNAPVSEDDFRP